MRALKYIAVGLFLIFALSILIHTNSSYDQDLGRHIVLGQIIWETKHIPTTNLFSYTHSEYPFLNHHWLSEVIFYLTSTLHEHAVTYLKIVVLLTAMTLSLLSARLVTRSTLIPILTSIIFLPLMIYRTDERPEIFGLLLFASYLYIFIKRKSLGRSRLIYLLPILQTLWINLHITFIYGVFLLMFFAIDDIFTHKSWFMSKILGVSIGLMILNPHGIEGILYPANVFQTYGYSIQENQNLFFLADLTANIFIKIFWAQFWALAIVSAVALYSGAKDRDLKKHILPLGIIWFFAISSIMLIRNFPFFAIAAIIYAPVIMKRAGVDTLLNNEWRRGVTYIGVSVILMIYTLMISSNSFYNTFDLGKRFEIARQESYQDATNYIRDKKLQGPIFNNFDIGGYLDYALYPTYKVFVDNRPEAYPPEFFAMYKNAQTHPNAMDDLIAQYNIQTIILAHTDSTPWAEGLLARIAELRGFEIVYLDEAAIILTRGDTARNLEFLEERLDRLIDQALDYQELLVLSRLGALVGDSERAQEALEKSYQINPASCIVRLGIGSHYLASDNLGLQFRGRDILKSTRWCPYTKNTKSQISML